MGSNVGDVIGLRNGGNIIGAFGDLRVTARTRLIRHIYDPVNLHHSQYLAEIIRVHDMISSVTTMTVSWEYLGIKFNQQAAKVQACLA